MKIVLICPSNMLYMPYVDNYEKILNENNADYDIINWDRLNIEDKSVLRYKDSKTCHQRSFFDYCNFGKFIVKALDENKYEKVIVFGIQLAYFLRRVLMKRYCGRYILDIRDYNKIIRFFDVNKVIRNSLFTVLSSPEYKEWLHSSDKYMINHNTKISSLEELKEVDNSLSNKKDIYIAYIGGIRDYQVNIEFINSLRNEDKFFLNFHGEGDINKEIEEYIKVNKITNVHLTGRYSKGEEQSFYCSNDMINVLRYNDGINNRTALPNRLYNAALNGKPMLGYRGTFLADQIEHYNLGLVVDSFTDIKKKINEYANSFRVENYEKGRNEFFSKVIEDNDRFRNALINFIKYKNK
ncbi:glycosyltransferase family 4 protein [Clostridium sp. HBUAS56017]|uniref:glycosyltransferase family 4 protein n=1 Tax=Clostridium sp. HBUAS56017 TaxID=2571128 RepID=UPI0011775F30|nr:glycosyltransferase family 4 protein [Clostridium sp. HBUAS56017]